MIDEDGRVPLIDIGALTTGSEMVQLKSVEASIISRMARVFPTALLRTLTQ
jgi:hypothetical protein